MKKYLHCLEVIKVLPDPHNLITVVGIPKFENNTLSLFMTTLESYCQG